MQVFLRLRAACVRAKHTLSSALQTEIVIDELADGEDLNLQVNRAKFERLCHPLFEKCFPCIDNALKDAKVAKWEIDDVVLVGGSTHIPKLREML